MSRRMLRGHTIWQPWHVKEPKHLLILEQWNTRDSYESFRIIVRRRWWHIFGVEALHLAGEDQSIEVYLDKLDDGKLGLDRSKVERMYDVSLDLIEYDHSVVSCCFRCVGIIRCV